MKNSSSILIVDDDPDDREMIREAFRSNNDKADYHFMANGEALLQYLNENKDNGLPVFILLDLNMPGRDGREVLRDLKSTNGLESVPVIVFTTSSSERDKQNAYESGANCFVTKPDTFDKLVEITGCILKLWPPAE